MGIIKGKTPRHLFQTQHTPGGEAYLKEAGELLVPSQIRIDVTDGKFRFYLWEFPPIVNGQERPRVTHRIEDLSPPARYVYQTADGREQWTSYTWYGHYFAWRDAMSMVRFSSCDTWRTVYLDAAYPKRAYPRATYHDLYRPNLMWLYPDNPDQLKEFLDAIHDGSTK